WLVRGTTALTAKDLALMTGFSAGIFDEALQFFQVPPSDWLEMAPFPGDSPAVPAEAPATPGDSPGAPGKSGCYPTLPNNTHKDKRESGASRQVGGAVAASRTRVSVLMVQIKELERNRDDLTAGERRELEKKRRLVRAIQEKQAEGKFEEAAE